MEIRVEQKEKEVEVYVGGMLNTQTASELEKALADVACGTEKLILDFAELEYISSAGLRVLVAEQKKLGRNGKICIRNTSPSVKEIFEITGLTAVFVME